MTKNKLAKLAATTKPLLTFNEDKSMATFHPGQGSSGQLNEELQAFNNSKWSAIEQLLHQVVAGQAPMSALPPAYQTALAANLHHIQAVQLPLPAFDSSQFVTNPTTMNDILQYPGATTTKNYFATVNHAAAMDPSSDTNYQATLTMPELEDLDVFLPDVGLIHPQEILLPGEETFDNFNTEVLRQSSLNEEAKDGLNAFFDFDHFD